MYGSSWLSTQRLEVGRVEGDDLHPHVGVAEPAELGALAGVDAGLVGLHPQVCTRPGTMSRLPLSLGIQKRVDDVAAGAADRAPWCPVGITSWPLVTIGLASADVGVTPQIVPSSLDRVVVLPPPLLAGDVDDALGVVGLVGQRQHRVDREPGDHGQITAGMAVSVISRAGLPCDLLGDRLAAVAEADDDVDQHGE